MKRSISFYAGVLLLSVHTNYVQGQSITPSPNGLSDKALTLLGRTPGATTARTQQAHSTAKTTGAGSRLIAHALYYPDGASFELIDSTYYAYSGNRGGDLVTPMNFDLAQYWNKESGGLVNNVKTIKTFDSHNNVLTQTDLLWYAPAGSWTNNTNIRYIYDASGNTLIETHQTGSIYTSSWENAYRYIFTYDGMNNQTSSMLQRWNSSSGVWGNQYDNIYSYIPGTTLLSSYTYLPWNDTSGTWDSSYRETYTYNSKNLKRITLGQFYVNTTSSWADVQQILYVYDSSDSLLNTATYQVWDTGDLSWNNFIKDTYTYNIAGSILSKITEYWDDAFYSSNRELYTYDGAGNNNTVTFQYMDEDSGKGWQNRSFNIMDFDAFHNNIQMISCNWYKSSSTWDSISRTQNSYNSHNQKTSSIFSFSDGSSFQPYYKDVYYYEAYTTGITNTINRGGVVKIFPIPATNQLNIDLQWQESQAFTVTLYDIQGRVWQQWSMPAAGTYKECIPVNDLPAGNYFIQFRGSENGQIVQRVTVAH